MAIAFDNSTQGQSPTRGASSETLSFTMGTVSDGYLTVIICRNDDTTTAPDDVTGVTYNGVAMTQLVKVNGNSTGRFMYGYIYGLANPASGAHNIVVSLTGSTGSRAYVVAQSYSGVKQTAQPDATATVIDATNPSTTLTTIADNCWIVMGGGDESIGAGTGVMTARVVHINGNTLEGYDSNGALTPAGAKTIGYTGSQSLWAVSLAPYVAASGPTNLKSLNTNLKANIKSYNGNLIANVKSINTNV